MKIRNNDHVLLFLDNKRTYLVQVKAGEIFSTHRGVISFDDIIGREFGSGIKTHQGHTFHILEPVLEDFMMKVKRKTQIIYPKDAGMILMKVGIKSGDRVIEIGAGSGALTMALANAVAPGGKVYAYDRNDDFIRYAAKNLRNVGLDDFVEFKLRDVVDGFDEENVDAVILDLPSPWEGIPPAYVSLKGGGRIASLSPTYNQVENTAIVLGQNKFTFIETVEIFCRIILARHGKTRPYERMIGHTGFLTFARKIIP